MSNKSFWLKVKKFFNDKKGKNKEITQIKIINYLNEIYEDSKSAEECSEKFENLIENFSLTLRTFRTKFKKVRFLFDKNDLKSLVYWFYIRKKYYDVVVKQIDKKTRFSIPIFLDMNLEKKSSFDNEYARLIFQNPKIGDFFYLLKNETQKEFEKVKSFLNDFHNENFKISWFKFTENILDSINKFEEKNQKNKIEEYNKEKLRLETSNQINGLIGEFFIALSFDNLKKQKSDLEDLKAILGVYNLRDSDKKISENTKVKIIWNLANDIKDSCFDINLFYSFQRKLNPDSKGSDDLRIEVKSSSKDYNYSKHNEKMFYDWLKAIHKNSENFRKSFWDDNITLSWNEIEGFFKKENFILIKNYNISYDWENVKNHPVTINRLKTTKENNPTKILTFWIKPEHIKKLLFLYFIHWEDIYATFKVKNHEQKQIA